MWKNAVLIICVNIRDMRTEDGDFCVVLPWRWLTQYWDCKGRCWSRRTAYVSSDESVSIQLFSPKSLNNVFEVLLIKSLKQKALVLWIAWNQVGNCQELGRETKAHCQSNISQYLCYTKLPHFERIRLLASVFPCSKNPPKKTNVTVLLYLNKAENASLKVQAFIELNVCLGCSTSSGESLLRVTVKQMDCEGSADHVWMSNEI